MIKLRIHHAFDIIRYIGDHDHFSPHEYGHSFHIVGERILNNESFCVVTGADDICTGCEMLNDNLCSDTINHRSDFILKQEFNDYLDIRISGILGIMENVELKLHSEKMSNYMEIYEKNIFEIYQGNDLLHTQERKRSFQRGVLKLESYKR